MQSQVNDLISIIRTQTKVSYKAKLNESNKPLQNIANFGMKKDQVATKSDTGEYANISIKACDNINPILTDRRIIKSLKLLKDENIQGAIAVLNISNYIVTHGISALYYTLYHWLTNAINNVNIPSFITNEYTKLEDTNLDDYIKLTRHDPVKGKFTINAVGQSVAGNTVVPIEWLNREFPDAATLHREMDKLEWRIGKPNVNYCIIYSITVLNEKSISYKDFIKLKNSDIYVYMYVSNTCSIYKSFELLKANFENIEAAQIMIHDDLIIFYDPTILIKYEKNKDIKHERIGLLASCLQKCIRRGKQNSKLLYDTILKLNLAPPYNLPEQQYIRVSGSKQLAWRLFISTIEDSNVYVNSNEICSLLDLVCYSIVCHLDNDLQFSDTMIKKIALTALHIQNISSLWKWKQGNMQKINTSYGFTEKTSILDSFKLALKFMPMMKGDKILLTKSINYATSNNVEFKKLKIIPINDLLNAAVMKIQNNTLVVSNDMHCTPNLLIYVQACLNYIPTKKESTKNLSKFIWDTSSSLNIRDKKDQTCENSHTKNLSEIIYYCQENINKEYKLNSKLALKKNVEQYEKSIYEIEDIQGISRLAFLLVFGQEIVIDKTNITVIFSSKREEPFKFRKKTETKYIQDAKLINNYINLLLKQYEKPKLIELPNLPPGYNWLFNKNKVKTSIKKIDDEFIFIVDNIKTKAFDGSCFIKKLDSIKLYDLQLINLDLPNQLICSKPRDPNFEMLLSDTLYLKKDYGTQGLKLINMLFARGRELVKQNINYMFEWKHLAYKIPTKVWQNIYVRLISGDNVSIYQVDRNGKKLLGACDYIYEGCILRMMLLLSLLYPFVVEPKSNFMTFKINSNKLEYVVMLNTIKELMLPNVCRESQNLTSQLHKQPSIITSLWDHQKLTSNSIYDGLINQGKKGYGDAASVGSGKTLTAISIMLKLLNRNNVNNDNRYNGFLVLVPNMKLIDTWHNEIKKHTSNFRVITQVANGSWIDNTGLNKNKVVSNDDCVITSNTIAITTLGRNRDKPKNNSWVMIIIDECLSVQNNDALQTQAAFRQVVLSQYGVIMLSATFFRARYDKLYFMLKMLQSNYPENRNYLSAIINEHIFCHISESKRNWITTIHNFKLSETVRKKYDEVKESKLNLEKKYQKLFNIVITEFDIVNAIKELLARATKENRKCLIYARSKAEANNIANTLNNVSKYPEKTKTHIVVSYQEGTFGLNDLTDYDTIVTRMNHLDIIIQQKGRLDRPGQQKNILNIDYILVENTIDEAWKLKYEMTNNFYKNYLLPLTEFYKIAINS